MPSQVVFHRLAKRELRNARTWYSRRSADAPHQFKTRVDEAIDRIASRPDAFPEYDDGFRYVRVSRFPYILVFYEITADSLAIVAVAHTSRRPGYWRGRKI